LVYTCLYWLLIVGGTNRLWSTGRAGAWGNWGVVPSLNSELFVSGSFTLWPLYLQGKSSITTEQETAWNPLPVGTSRWNQNSHSCVRSHTKISSSL
jgi:hypothetical protein